MTLSNTLRNALAEVTKGLSLSDLKRASKAITQQYRDCQGSSFADKSFVYTAAYLHVRMTAIYAVIQHILKELIQRDENHNIRTVLDLGAGPGTATWVCFELFSSLEKSTLIEQSSSFIQAGKKLSMHNSVMEQKLHWISSKLQDARLDSHDLVILSFVLNELSEKDRYAVIDRAWQASDKYLLIVEPGDPKGFERIRDLRSYFIEKQAHIMAPCPHNKPCPIQGTDWCHFFTRVERTKMHKFMKEGTRGYEDEKFMYLLLSKQPVDSFDARVLRHPALHSGHTKLKLCHHDGDIREVTASKRDKVTYRKSKKIKWGDVW